MKITATIQARMGSSRLPGKILKKMGGKPMLQRHIERIQRSRLIDEIVVATTTSPKDDPLVELTQQLGVKVFRGSEEDVIGRIAALLKEHQVEIHVELIGDSPLADPQIIDEVIGFYLKHQDQYDYVSNGIKVTYPSGAEVYVYSASILLEAEASLKKDDPMREHVDLHLNKKGRYRCANLEAPSYYHYPDIYIEVDTETDFQMVSAIFEHFDQQGHEHFSLAQVLEFLKARPDLIKLNQKVERNWWQFKEGYA